MRFLLITIIILIKQTFFKYRMNKSSQYKLIKDEQDFNLHQVRAAVNFFNMAEAMTEAFSWIKK
jgi:hypothetical protein